LYNKKSVLPWGTCFEKITCHAGIPHDICKGEIGMRVIAGSARGRRLKTLEGMDVRPTTDKVKEAIFSAIQFDLPDAAVLDLFAGSGQMGIEALSRGAASVVFVDRSARSLQVTRENLESVQFAEQAQLHQTEAQSFLQSTAMQFDIAILDPPYRKGMHEKLLPLLAEHMADNGIVICEHETGLEMPQSVGVLEQKKQKKYGAITVTTYICRRD
jgi:16S rRNA (guanine(966)-N(2))-methyltransferase RsmD